MASDSLFSLESVSKIIELPRETVHILNDVTFNVHHKQKVAIKGASGSGKSTLLSLMAGLDRPTSGSTMFNGVDLSSLNNDQLADQRLYRIGFVYQDFQLMPHLTVLENVMLPLELQGQAEEECYKRAVLWLDKVNMSEHSNKFPTVLSGGEKQRVAIARACVGKPDVILADEPTGNLDDHTAEMILDLIFSTCQEHGITFVVATHDKRVFSRCDSILELSAGKINE